MSSTVRRALWCVCAVLVVIMLRKLVVQMARLDGDLSVYYHAANELTSGMTPYRSIHYIYPPLFAWLMAPIAQLTPAGYAVAWGLLLGACWLACGMLVSRLLGDTDWTVGVVTAALLFRCVWNGWGHGQPTLLLCAMMLAFLALEREGRLVAASFWLAFAGSLKIFPFYLGALYLEPGRRRWIPLLAAVTVALSLLPALTLGIPWFASLVVNGFFGPAARSIQMQHSWSVNHAVVPHLFQLLGVESVDALRVALIVSMVFHTALVLLTPRPREDRDEDTLWLAWVVTTLLMVSPHVFLHYMTLLLFPLAAALHFVRARPWQPRAWVLAAGIVVAGVALNVGSHAFVSTDLSNDLDTYGVPSLGLAALWASLAFAVMSREPALATLDGTRDLREHRADPRGVDPEVALA